MIRLLIDINLSPKWAEYLADAGISAVHWSEVGAPTASDPEIMTFAAAQNYVVLTHDLDFGTILAAAGAASPSVIQIRADDPSPLAIGPAIVRAVNQQMDAIMAGALLTVEPARSRIALLPLNR